MMLMLHKGLDILVVHAKNIMSTCKINGLPKLQNDFELNTCACGQ